MTKEKIFVRDETCEFPNTCKAILCQRGLVIRQEIRNIKEEIIDHTGDLRVVVKEATCEHPEVQEAINVAQVLLEERSE